LGHSWLKVRKKSFNLRGQRAEKREPQVSIPGLTVVGGGWTKKKRGVGGRKEDWLGRGMNWGKFSRK